MLFGLNTRIQRSHTLVMSWCGLTWRGPRLCPLSIITLLTSRLPRRRLWQRWRRRLSLRAPLMHPYPCAILSARLGSSERQYARGAAVAFRRTQSPTHRRLRHLSVGTTYRRRGRVRASVRACKTPHAHAPIGDLTVDPHSTPLTVDGTPPYAIHAPCALNTELYSNAQL